MATIDEIGGNGLDPQFQSKIERVQEYFFSRNPDYWPVFNEPGFREVLDFRQCHHRPEERLHKYPAGEELFAALEQRSDLDAQMKAPGQRNATLNFAAALSKEWENPSSVENVGAMSSDPALYGFMMGAMANPNLVHRYYSEMADDLEQVVVRQMANLAGYDPQRATGIFTQGGTLCNLYGYLLGIRKSLPESRSRGLGRSEDFRIINSQGGHYSNVTNLSLLGVDIRKKSIRIKMNDDNEMDLEDFEYQLESCLRFNCVVPTIMLTMGTTDTFAVDRVKPVWEIRNRLCEKFEIEVKPHIHVDAAVGWAMLFFCGYDFATNPLGVNRQTLASMQRNCDRFSEMKYADSFTIDFHKWGYVPYMSSLIMIREQDDLKALENDPENFSYFEKNTQGHSHLQSTIECSRGAAGLFGAFNGLDYMGVEGYQTVLAHCLQNANYFRQRLGEIPHARIFSSNNHGPSVAFRLYNPATVGDAEEEFAKEYAIEASAEYRQRLDANSQRHHGNYQRRGKEGIFSSWIKSMAHTDYDERDRFLCIPGEKVVFMNPLTSREDIDIFIERLKASLESAQ